MRSFFVWRVLLFALIGLFVSGAEAKSKSRADTKSSAHKQYEFVDPQDTEHWVSQFNAEVDRYSNADYLYGNITTSRHNWSFQLGGQNIPLTAGNPTVPFVYAGVIKQIDLNSLFNFTVGSVLGSYTNTFTFLNFDYVTFGVNREDYTLAVGPYYANKDLTETVSKVGYVIFWNYNVWDFSINGSYLSGDNNISGLSANLGYNINRYLQPYLGFGDVAPNLACELCSQYYYMALGFNFNF
jgi:hypothetical protein